MRTFSIKFLFVLSLFQLACLAEMLGQSANIEIEECIQVDSVHTDFPFSHSFIEQENWQFIAETLSIFQKNQTACYKLNALQ